MRTSICSSILMSLVASGAALGQFTVTFENITGAGSANDMSPDGRFIVGETTGFQPYLLDTQTGVMTILPSPGLSAVAVSDDGTVVLGDIPDPTGVGTEVAAIWTAESKQWTSLGFLPDAGACPSRSNGYELSADGSVAVGLSWDGCNGLGFIWTEATGMLPLEEMANGGNRASVISADGMVIGGFAQGTFDRTPAIWNADDMSGELLDPPSGNAQGEVHGMSDDGTILLGEWLTTEPTSRASKWTLVRGNWVRETLGEGSILPGWGGIATDIADNGTIVGFDFLLGNRRAWIQPFGEGDLIAMNTFVFENGGTLPSGALLQVAQAITTDGRIIIGHGGPLGSEAWRITIDVTGDLNGDGCVTQSDLGILLSSFLLNDGGDLNDDGETDQSDLGILLAAFDVNCNP